MIISARTPLLWTVIFFILLGGLTLHLVAVVYSEAGIINLGALKQTIHMYKELYILGLLSIVSIFFATKKSIILYSLFSLFLVVELIKTQVVMFDKVAVIVIFILASLSYFFYQMLSAELKEPFFNPNYDASNLFDPMLKIIEVKLIDKNDKTCDGILTNWSENGAYVYLKSKEKLTGKVTVEVSIDDVCFSQEGELVAYDSHNNGVGIKFSYSKIKLGWNDLIKVLEDRGYDPEYLR